MNLSKRLRLQATLLSSLLALASCTGSPSAGEAAIAREQTLALWSARCMRCHGESGAGNTAMGETVSAPDMMRPEWQRTRVDDQLAAVITGGLRRVRDGELRTMPANPDLTPAQVAGLVMLVRAFER